MSKPSPLLAYTLLTSLLSVAGCASNNDSSELAEESVDSAMSGQSEAALLVALVDGTNAATPEAAAQQVATLTAFQPAGCATVAVAGTTATVAFDDCTGPRGLVGIDGTVSVTIDSVTPTSLDFTASATNLRIAGATLDLALDASYVTAGGTTTIEVASTSSGAGPLGYEITHAGEYVATWDASCASVDGSWATAGELARRSLDVSLTRCRTGCPTGDMTRTRLDGSTISISFDGTAAARWESSRRGSGTVQLLCTP